MMNEEVLLQTRACPLKFARNAVTIPNTKLTNPGGPVGKGKSRKNSNGPSDPLTGSRRVSPSHSRSGDK